MTNLPEILMELMHRKGMNRAQLARASGLSKSVVYDIATGRAENPRSSTLNALAAALDCQPELLLNAATSQVTLIPAEYGALVRNLRLRHNLSQSELADRAGTSEIQIELLEKGMLHGQRLKEIDQLAQALRVPVEHLLSGTATLDDLQKLAGKQPGTKTPSLTSGPENGIELAGKPYAAVPEFDLAVSAGPGSLVDDGSGLEPIGYQLIALDRLDRMKSGPTDMVASVTVRGDSMEPTLRHGDQVLIDRSITRPRDGIFVIFAFDELLVKRLTVDIGQEVIHVSSDNTLHRSFEIQADEADRLHLCGRVIWIGRGIA